MPSQGQTWGAHTYQVVKLWARTLRQPEKHLLPV